jgi:hypothetical protein
MSKKIFSVALALAISASAISQTQSTNPIQIGTVDDVQGLVTVSDGSSVGNAVKGAPVVDGTRYVTSSTGSATLKMDNGCNVHLNPNQSLVVQDKQDCEALIAAIQTLSDSNRVLALLGNPLVGLGSIASAALISTARNGGPISGQ